MEFLLNSSDVGVYGFVEQAGLSSVKLLAATAKLPTLEDGHLVGQLLDLGLAIKNLAVLAGDGLVQDGDLLVEAGDLLVKHMDVQIALADLHMKRTDLQIVAHSLCDQISDELAQLLCVQIGQ